MVRFVFCLCSAPIAHSHLPLNFYLGFCEPFGVTWNRFDLLCFNRIVIFSCQSDKKESIRQDYQIAMTVWHISWLFSSAPEPYFYLSIEWINITRTFRLICAKRRMRRLMSLAHHHHHRRQPPAWRIFQICEKTDLGFVSLSVCGKLIVW